MISIGIRLSFDVRARLGFVLVLYIILLLYYYYYYILYYTLLFFLSHHPSLPSHPSLPFLSSLPILIYLSIQSIRVGIWISLFIYSSDLSSVLFSSSLPFLLLLFFPLLLLFLPHPHSSSQSSSSHSKYTCRCLLLDTYISSSSRQSDPACFIGVDG